MTFAEWPNIPPTFSRNFSTIMRMYGPPVRYLGLIKPLILLMIDLIIMTLTLVFLQLNNSGLVKNNVEAM